MKRLFAFGAVIVLLLLGFYVAWPGWTAYQIANAIKAKDQALLERKIDFDGVRGTLRPVAEGKIAEIYDKFQQQAGPAAQIVVGQIKKDVIPKIAETAIKTLVTPEYLIRVVTDGGTIKQNAEKILQEQVGKIGLPGLPGGGAAAGGGGMQLPGGIKLPGGLGQMAGQLGIPGLGGGGAAKPSSPIKEVAAEPEKPASAAAGSAPASYGLGNIKKFGFLGPFGFEIGVAKDAAASEADVVAEMRFINGDWRVTGVRPKI